MRKVYAIRNTVLAILSQLLMTLILFVNRRVFALILGKEYLGVNGLFNDILGMLAVAELGIGAAIVFALYEPVAKNDIPRIGALLRFYKKAYWSIGCFMGVVGMALIPFLNILVKDVSSIPHYIFIYIIILFNSIVTYFFSYKITIVTVLQKSYIQNIITTLFNFLQTIGQILILLLTKNYILYLCIQFVCTILMNIVISTISVRMNPDFFKKENMNKLESSEQRALFKNIKALFLHRIGTFLVKGTDNIIITMFLGLASGGVYSNYHMISNCATRYFSICYNAITATVGNYNALESKSKTEQMFYNINFLSFVGNAVVTVVLICATEPLIILWLGYDFLDSYGVTIMVALTFYLAQIRASLYVIKNAQGIFYQDRYKPIVESIVNLAVSVFFVKYYGVIGVLIGTFISGFFVGLFVEVYVIYKYGFKSTPRKYIIDNIKYFAVCSASGVLSYVICTQIIIGGLFGLILKCIIAVVLTLLLIFLFFRKTVEYDYIKNVVLNIINKNRKLEG